MHPTFTNRLFSTWSDTYMAVEDVLAVVLEDVATGSTHSYAEIKRSVEASGSL